MLNFGNKEFRNLQEQVLKNAQDIEILKEKPNLSISIVDELPETGQEGILYLVPSSDPELENAYDEYVWLPESESFEMVGSTAIDLSNMVTTDTTQTITGEKTFSADVNVQGDINLDGELILGTGMSVKNHAPGSDNYLDLIQGGSNRMAVGSSTYSYVDFLPGADAQRLLGSSSMRWKTLNLSHYVDWGNNAMIYKDSSNRVVISAGGNDRIKVGTVDSTYCVANWTPDSDSTYNLGRDNVRWAAVNAGRIQNKFSSFFIEANGDVNVKCSNSGGLVPSSNNLFSLGKAGQLWSTVYANSISDGTNSVDVADIATKPDYANPDVWASGTLGSGTGEDNIDLSIVGMPDDGLYMFTYGNAQCFVALTSTMIQNATLYPMRCPCPVLKESGGSIEGATGNLKISRSSDILTIKVASTISGSATSTNGWGWQLIKVM